MPRVRANFKEMRRFNANLRELSRQAGTVMKFALYDGAAIAAEAMRSTVSGLRAVPDAQSIQAWRRGAPTFINATQKAGLLKGLGITHMKDRGNGTIDVRVGFEGYNAVVTRRWPKGQPNVMIAASCEHGSSAMLPQPFVRPAYSRTAAQITAAMEETADKKIEEILNL